MGILHRVCRPGDAYEIVTPDGRMAVRVEVTREPTRSGYRLSFIADPDVRIDRCSCGPDKYRDAEITQPPPHAARPIAAGLPRRAAIMPRRDTPSRKGSGS